MRIEKSVKEGWIEELANSLASAFEEQGLRRRGKKTFIWRRGEAQRRYVLSVRYPRYADDPHLLYLDPCFHVRFDQINELKAELSGWPIQKGFGTVGGSVGRLVDGSMREWPVDDLASALALKSQFERDFRESVVPFWENIASHEQLLNAIEAGHANVAALTRGWEYELLALIHLVRGLDESLAFFRERKEKRRKTYRGVEEDRIRAILESWSRR